jgi:hypothetical protein
MHQSFCDGFEKVALGPKAVARAHKAVGGRIGKALHSGQPLADDAKQDLYARVNKVRAHVAKGPQAPRTPGAQGGVLVGQPQQPAMDAGRQELNKQRAIKAHKEVTMKPTQQPASPTPLAQTAAAPQPPPPTEGFFPKMKRKLFGNQPASAKPAQAEAPAQAPAQAPATQQATQQTPAEGGESFLSKHKVPLMAAGGAGAVGYMVSDKTQQPPPQPQTQASYQYY